MVLFLLSQSEDEALQRALELLLAEPKPQAPSSLEEEDLALAQALSASESEYRQLQGPQQVTGRRNALSFPSRGTLLSHCCPTLSPTVTLKTMAASIIWGLPRA